ncbi:glucan endo-1,3-beta-glucosidase 12-like [Diospyros lotus]|uniref:glucan endo-1,3-beta-glucosidase 12-like n=1 Tax=Diospyros lotus TaxID=55363 RepID=UPI00224E3262|nr:glucan endo-1,3-beta-glucosidase 12-like [Diospyros lotus]
MLKMAWPSVLFSLCFLLSGLAGTCQGSVEHLSLRDASPVLLHVFSADTDLSVAVSIEDEQLNEVSRSVIAAETWLRTHVLAHYPATNITAIVVGNTVLCNKNRHQQMGLLLPSVKNIFHSLKRWGLEKEIKVSASFSSDCLNPNSSSYRNDLAEKYVRPLLDYFQAINSPYLVNPPPHFTPSQALSLVSSHAKAMNSLGIFKVNKINVLFTNQKEAKPVTRKLSSLAPTHSPVVYSVPEFPSGSPLPPLVGASPPLPFSLPSAPELPPVSLPPCNPVNTGPPTPLPKSELWCVAKPSVPAETLQEAMDYACGEGGADCEAIQPDGNCYFPDTVVAHASYAFNSYWQKNKRNGGTCSFGGTGMLINADPSFRHCRFVLA